MKKVLLVLFLLLCSVFGNSLYAQVYPADNAALNYRIVGFSFPAATKGNYHIEVARGDYNDIASFNQNIIKRHRAETNKVIIELPFFGCAYTWRATGEHVIDTVLHHFTIMTSRDVDTTITRLRVTKQAKKYKDAFVFLDANRALYDMNGNAVWFLPRVDSDNMNQNLGVIDLQLSPKGTITFLATNNQAYEVDYNARILWKKQQDPNNHSIFHHSFNRLHNGHYIILSDETLLWEQSADSINFYDPLQRPDIAVNGNKKISFGTIGEYDEKGNKVWEWRSSAYYRRFIHTEKDINGPYGDVHANAIFFDEVQGMIYMSFKKTNQILKIKYPEGQVVRVYGSTDTAKAAFCAQHACKISHEGYLYMLNNNECTPGQHPEVLMFREPKAYGEELKELWRYEYPEDSVYHLLHKEHRKNRTTNGGNVMELGDGSIFIALCKPFANILIVNRNKETIWSAVPQRRLTEPDHWVLMPEYKASIITDRKQLETLIWNSENYKPLR